MQTIKTEKFSLAQESDVVHIRRIVREWASGLKFSLVDSTKIVTAASEIARNTVIYGGGGSLQLEVLENMTKKGLRLIFEDKGPGIPDLKLALQDGYTTGNGLGLGLSGSKRLVNEFNLESKVGEGTKVTLVRWK
jgi:serine/threonine-protein kinase RsbT